MLRDIAKEPTDLYEREPQDCPIQVSFKREPDQLQHQLVIFVHELQGAILAAPAKSGMPARATSPALVVSKSFDNIILCPSVCARTFVDFI